MLDEGYSYDLSVEDAKELGMKSIYHATYRDAASGGFVNCKFTKLVIQRNKTLFSVPHEGDGLGAYLLQGCARFALEV